MSTLFFRQWRVTALFILVVVAAGGSALLTIGRQEDPTITNLFATVVTPYPGADPAQVEALVTEKIEEELREIAEIKEILSTSRNGFSIIQVELLQTISDQEIENAWAEIRDALSDAARNLPAGVPEPGFDNDRTGAFSAISAITMRDGRPVEPALLRRYGEQLSDILRQVPGTKQVETYGAGDEEILVEIDPRRMTSQGLTVADVSRAIAAADVKVPAGQVRGRATDLLIEVGGEIDAVRRVAEIPLIDGRDGSLLKLGDIAAVSRAMEDPALSLAYADGKRAVLIAVKMEEGRQVDSWAAAIRERLDDFEATLPAGMEHSLIFDQSRYTIDRLSNLTGNLLIGVGIVFVVLFVTLGWRSALIVGATIPLASLTTLAVLQQVGLPIHQMSVTGLIVALGLLVDAAIVMTDAVRRRLQEGMPRLEAVRASVHRLAVPLLASTVTTVLAFMPMALLPGPAGDFVGAIAVAVITMLFASFFLAITVTPALSGRFLRQEPAGKTARWWESGANLGFVGRPFAATVRTAMRYPLLGLLAGMVLPLIGFGAFPTLQAQFFPGVDRDQLHVQLYMPPGTAIAATERAALEADRLLRGEGDIAQVSWVIGESAPSFYYNMIANQDRVGRFAEALITTASPEATERLIPTIQQSLDRALPGAQVIVRGLVQGPPVTAPLEMRIVGPNPDVLRRLGETGRALMSQVPSVQHTLVTMPGGAPKLRFDLSEEKVRLTGMTLGTVARQLDSLAEGTTGGSLVEASEELPVRVRLADAARGSAAAVSDLDILPGDAATAIAAGRYPGVPLTALGESALVPAETVIARKDGERAITVRGYIQRDVLPATAFADFQAVLAENPDFTMPSGYRIEWGGDSDERQETVGNLMASLGLIVTITIATIVLAFNSFRLSLITGIVAILSMGLSFLALAIFQYPFGINALIGVIGSIGVSINAAIIILTGMQLDEGARRGEAEGMTRVVTESSRHIVSTTVTTFGGFLPLIVAGGGFWPPFAMAIAGGVLLSTIVSLYFTPSAYALMAKVFPLKEREVGDLPAEAAVAQS